MKYSFIQHMSERVFAGAMIAILMVTAFPHDVYVVHAEVEASIEAVARRDVFDAGELARYPISDEAAPVRDMIVIATAYSSDPYQTDATPCIPAMQDFDMCAHFEQNGLENTIAANFLPLGTQVRFPDLFGDKVFVVRDRMNARYNGTRRIDFWVGSAHPETPDIIRKAKRKATGFGVQRVKMEIYK